MLLADPECGEPPRCLTPQGCPIEDIATDTDITRYMEMYLMAKHLYRMTEDPSVQRGTFERLGLYKDTQLHLRLEIIYSKWIQQEQEKQRAKK